MSKQIDSETSNSDLGKTLLEWEENVKTMSRKEIEESILIELKKVQMDLRSILEANTPKNG
jgi:ribosomal protein L29